jgi:CopG antitoxin of type II toxin-antitoxin system
MDVPVVGSAQRYRELVAESTFIRTGTARNRFVVFAERDPVARPDTADQRPLKCIRERWRAMKKTIPTFKTDKEAEDFVATADLTDYDLSGGEVVRFELKRKDKSVNL